MDNQGPLFTEQAKPKRNKTVSIITEIFILVFIGALLYFVFFLNNNKKKPVPEDTTTTSTSTTTTTTSTSSTSSKTIHSFTTSKTTQTGPTKPKQYTLDGILNDIRNGYNVYSINQLANVGFEALNIPQTGLKMDPLKSPYYEKLLSTEEAINNDIVISSKATIYYYKFRTDIFIRKSNKNYSVQNAKVLAAYPYKDNSGWYDIFLIADDGVYRFSHHASISLNKISDTVYDDVVAHSKGKNTAFYYVKNNKYYNTSTLKEEIHDDDNDAYDNGIIKIKTNRDVYIYNNNQGYKYKAAFVDNSGINRIIVSGDNRLYEYYYDNNTKTVSYHKISDSKVSKYMVYSKNETTNYVVFIFSDNKEIVRNNYFLRELPNELT